MIKIIIKDWSKGFMALELISLLKQNGYGLIESKLLVEELLDRNEILVLLEHEDALNSILSMPLTYEILDRD